MSPWGLSSLRKVEGKQPLPPPPPPYWILADWNLAESPAARGTWGAPGPLGGGGGQVAFILTGLASCPAQDEPLGPTCLPSPPFHIFLSFPPFSV